ncbi:MAG TPA: ATPase, partial [Paracoccaceae bacterium]
MIYKNAKDWRAAPAKRVLLFGMSGLGKTHVANMLRQAPQAESGGWFHYSVDYRIGTRYMGEYIADNFKREAMRVPFLRELLMTDSVYIQSNITFNNLAPLSTYLGKPGNPDKGGVPFAEYMTRQAQHREAEIAALLDTPRFIERARAIYGYNSFVCDSGGSICEVVDPENPADPVMRTLSDNLLLVWIKGSDAHTAELIRRFDRAPKPMYYQPEFLQAAWAEYLGETNATEAQVDPDAFV